MIGNDGANSLSGGDGADLLRGLGGSDLLRGGAGADTFDFDALADSGVGASDLIHDFQLGLDKIDVSTIDANTSANKNQAFSAALLGGLDQSFAAAGQLRYGYSEATGTTIVQGNVDTDTAPDFEIHLVGDIPLTAAALVL